MDNIVIREITIDGFAGWVGDFAKPVSINDSVKGLSVKHILKNGTCLASMSKDTKFSIINCDDVTLKVTYEKKFDLYLNDDDIKVLIDSENKPFFDIVE